MPLRRLAEGRDDRSLQVDRGNRRASSGAQELKRAAAITPAPSPPRR